MTRAFFGPPQPAAVRGGARITLYLVPVLDGQLVAFDLKVSDQRGRWLPWTVMDFGANPYVTASELAEQWCQGAVSALSPADVMSFETPDRGWELAIVFRADLTVEPRPPANGTVSLLPPGGVDAIGPFAPGDLERWLTLRPSAAPLPRHESGGMPLLF